MVQHIDSAGDFMSYNYADKKIVAVLAANLEMGIAVNVIGHLAISIGAYAEDGLMGRPVLLDKSGTEHVGIAKYPFIITKVKPGRLKKFVEEARVKKELFLVDYPAQMLSTAHDDELAEELSKTETADIQYLGAIIYGDSQIVSALTGRFTLYR